MWFTFGKIIGIAATDSIYFKLDEYRMCVFPCFYRNHKADGFYVPGVAPQDFGAGDPIEVRAIKMTSSKTQLPYEYYRSFH